MAIAIRGGVPGIGSNGGSSATVAASSADSSPQIGDVCVVIHGNDFYTAASMPTPTATGSPTLTAIPNGTCDAGTNLTHIKSYTYVANTNGTQTVTVTESGPGDEDKYIVIYPLSGADSTTPIDTASNTSGSSATSQPASSVSPTSTNAYVILANNSGGGAATASYTSPGGSTEQYEVHTGTMSGVGATQQLSASGATGTFTFTANTAVPWGSITIAINTANTDLSVNAGLAAATGAGFTLAAGVNPNAGNAAATGAGFAEAATIAPSAGVSAGTGVGFSPAASVAPAAGLAAGTGAGFAETLTSAILAGNAAATGVANDTQAGVGPAAGLAAATGVANGATITARISAGTAIGTGRAFDVTAMGGDTRVLVVVFGAPQPKWLFGTFRSTDSAGNGGAVIQSSLATTQVQVPVAAFVDGDPVDPTADVIEMAFVVVGDNPGSGDWNTGSWSTAPGGTYYAQCLVGPAATGVDLTRGIWAVWVRITDSPEVPVAQVGTLQIV